MKAMRAAADAKAKKTGKTIFDICLGWIYDEDLPLDRRQAAWKLYCDKMLIQVSEGGEADKALGPAMYLPEKRPVLTAIPKAADEPKVA